MIELLTRFVVAVELIAASLSKGNSSVAIETVVKTAAEEGRAGTKEDQAPEKKPRARNTKKEEPKGPDFEQLRKDIKQAASDIAAGDSDECADKFEDLLEDYDVRNVGKLADDQVEDFYKDLKKLASKYYDIQE